MSRSYRKPWWVDGARHPKTKHENKKDASRRHRHGEKQELEARGEEYQPRPSLGYTDPYDICDWKWYAPEDPKAGRK